MPVSILILVAALSVFGAMPGTNPSPNDVGGGLPTAIASVDDVGGGLPTH